MSRVTDILEQMAANAGQAARYRGALIGNAVDAVGNIPADVAAARDKQRIEAQRTAQVQQQMGLAAAQGARETVTAGQQTQNFNEGQDKLAEAKRRETVNRQAWQAAVDGSGGDPAKIDIQKGMNVALTSEFPDVAAEMHAHYDAMQKPALPLITNAPGSITSDPNQPRDQTTGQFPVVARGAPLAPTTAGNEAVIRGLYAKKASGVTLTPDESNAITGYETEHSANDAPVTVKTMENGKPVEKVMTRAQALAAGSFQSQPPASIQVNNAVAATASQPSSPAEKAMANYMLPPISPRSMATPAGKVMMDHILAENPSYDASLFSVRAPTRKAFTTGTQGQQITAMNTAIEHLDQLQGAADALKNGEFKPGNAAYNYLKETFGANAPTNYDTIKTMVDKEVEAVANKGVPTVQGTNEQKALAGKSASPEQLKGYIDTLIPLMGSKLNALHYQYTQAMGDKDPFKPITPTTQSILTQRGFDPNNLTGKTSTSTVGVPTNVAAALKGLGAGKHTLSDGSVWLTDAAGNITKGQ